MGLLNSSPIFYYMVYIQHRKKTSKFSYDIINLYNKLKKGVVEYMKYFTLNIEDFKILEIFNTLKELRESYSEIDIIDYMDDLDATYNNKYFVSEEFFSSLIEKSKTEENNESLRDIISLKEELDEMKEQYSQANVEIETVHGEYVKILNSDNKNKETIKKYEQKVSELNSLKSELELKIKELDSNIIDIKNKHKEKLNNVSKILASNYKPQIEKKLEEILNKINNCEKDIEIYREEV